MSDEITKMAKDKINDAIKRGIKSRRDIQALLDFAQSNAKAYAATRKAS
jgi:hypothetical protein